MRNLEVERGDGEQTSPRARRFRAPIRATHQPETWALARDFSQRALKALKALKALEVLSVAGRPG